MTLKPSIKKIENCLSLYVHSDNVLGYFVREKLRMQLHPDVLIGTAFGLLMSLFWAFSANAYNSQREKVRPIAIASFKMWLALGVISIVVLFLVQSEPFYMPVESILFITISVVIGTVLGDTIYLAGQERIGVAYAYPITNIFPIITYLLSITFLGEELTKRIRVGKFMVKFRNKMILLQDLFYKFVRCELAHEAHIPEDIKFTEGDTLHVKVDEKEISLSEKFIGILFDIVIKAEENKEEFKDILGKTNHS